MRIVIWTDHRSTPWGGSEVLWSETAKCLATQGHEVVAVVGKWRERPEPFEALLKSGVSLWEVSSPNRGLLSRVVKIELPAAIKVNPDRNIHRRIKSFRPDIVLVSLSYAPTCSISILEYLSEQNIPFATVAQVMNPSWRVDSATAAFMRTVGHAAVRNFFVSQDNQVNWEKYIGAALPNARVVRNPFQVNRDAELPWPDTRDGWKLACVGRLDLASKGQDFIIELLAQEKWKERKVTVDFYGSGSSREILEQLAKDWGCDHKISFRGHVGQIEDVWKDHHALILLSRYEGLPLAVVEAMHCGRICLVTDVAGNREVVDHGRTGFVAKGSNIRSIDEAMEEAWSRREEWEAMGQEASKSIREIIPANPAEVFAKQLIDCVSSSSL